MSLKSILFILILLSLVPIIALGIDYIGSNSRTRAAVSELSTESSYVFVSPSVMPYGVNNKVRITVFCIDNKGFGKPNMRVALETSSDIVVSVIQGLSDDKGKAIFDAFAIKPTSTTLGVYCGTTKITSEAQLNFQ